MRPALTRRHVYIDTMGLHPALVRSAVDLLGSDHVVMGTDWPIVEEKSVPERLHKAFAFCGLDASRAADDRQRQYAEIARRFITNRSSE